MSLEEKVDLMMEAVILMSKQINCTNELGVIIRKLKKQVRNANSN